MRFFASLAMLLILSAQSFAAVAKKPTVFTSKIEVIELSEMLTYPARVEPRIKASVVAEADGVVTKIIAPLGSSVRAKAPLLVIRNTDPVYRYSPMQVTSAVDGVVSRVEVTEGSRVARGDKLILVTDPEQVRVATEITSQDVSSIRPGMTAELRIAGTEKPVELKVKGISPFVDPATGTASCELELKTKPNGKHHMPPLGIIGRVVFRVNIRKGISISDNAITYRGKDPFVRIVANSKAKLVPVTLGRKEAGTVEVIGGLNAGDQIIERASGFISDGEDVEIQTNASTGKG